MGNKTRQRVADKQRVEFKILLALSTKAKKRGRLFSYQVCWLCHFEDKAGLPEPQVFRRNKSIQKYVDTCKSTTAAQDNHWTRSGEKNNPNIQFKPKSILLVFKAMFMWKRLSDWKCQLSVQVSFTQEWWKRTRKCSRFENAIQSGNLGNANKPNKMQC